jgi:5,6-dimethylbenzimidazole synthase
MGPLARQGTREKAEEQAMNPDTYSELERAAVYRVIRERRDIRQFRPDAVAPEVLARLLAAAHLAPSVGFMQPWAFVLIKALELRKRIKAAFEEQNARELAKVPGPARQDLYRRLKLEGILEAPLNVAVACDRRRDAPFVLGRAPMPETDLFSTCLAVENLWLAARAEGVGVGWVSILDREATEGLLGFPPGVRLVAYLCMGYPVEFRPRPMLEEVGWKDRLPLDGVVFQERWGTPASLQGV